MNEHVERAARARLSLGCARTLIARAALLLACALLPHARAAESVCAEVKIEIKQTVTLERQAFDAKLKIRNGLSLPVEAIKVELNFADADGVAVPATTNPDDNGAAKFFFRADGATGITGELTGSGVVAPESSGEAQWLIIPTATAGGQTPDGIAYRVGAKITYRMGTETKTVEVTPDTITVKPQPKLRLDYFLTRHVYGDDPFTPATEPTVPFTLGVRVWNYGYGRANNVAIETAQPQIKENEQGLLIDFLILDSYVGETPAQPTLKLGFGAIDAGTARMGRWNMTASLSGYFFNFVATLRHADEFGGALTALIGTADIKTHDLVRDVLSDLPGRDAVRDFLAYDTDVLRLYESDGGLAAGTAGAADVAEVSGTLSGGGNTRELTAASSSDGYVYARVVDPFNGQLDAISARRQDGKALPAANVWFSKERDGSGEQWQYFINVFDFHDAQIAAGGQVRYTLTTSALPVHGASISGIVYEDADADGVHDTGESALLDAAVTLTHVWSEGDPWPPQNMTDYPARTDALGRFAFKSLKGGQYALKSHAVSGYNHGATTIGTAGGSAHSGPNAGEVSMIVLGESDAATGYAFAKVPVTVQVEQTDLSAYLSFLGSTATTGAPIDGVAAVRNHGLRAVSARFRLELPTGAAFESATPEQGTFDLGSGIWTTGVIAPNGLVRMPVSMRIGFAGQFVARGSVEIVDAGVVDTNPENNAMNAPVEVLRDPSYTFDLAENTKQRILMLAACPPAAAGGEDAACLATRVQAFESLFESSGSIEHRIVTTEAEFLAQIRSRRWRTYWLDSGAARTLGDAALAEIAQAQLRDEALVVDWPRGRSAGDFAGAAKLEALLPVRRIDAGPNPAGVTVKFQGEFFGAIDGTLQTAGGYDHYESLSSATARYATFQSASGPVGDPRYAPLQVINERTIVFGFDLLTALQANAAYRSRVMGQIQSNLAVPRSGNIAAGRRIDVMTMVSAYGTSPIPTWIGLRFPSELALSWKHPEDASAIDGGLAWTRALAAQVQFRTEIDVQSPVAGGRYTFELDVRQSDAAGAAGGEPKSITFSTQGASELASAVRAYLPDAGSDALTERLAAVDTAMQLRADGNHAAAIEKIVQLSSIVAAWRTGAAPELARLAMALGDLGEVLSREWYLALPACTPPASVADGDAPQGKSAVAAPDVANACRTPEA